jgi:hypothetical protein
MTKLERVRFDTHVQDLGSTTAKMQQTFESSDDLRLEMAPDGDVQMTARGKSKWISRHHVIEWVETPAEFLRPALGDAIQVDPCTEPRPATPEEIAKLTRSEQVRKAANARYAKGKAADGK